MSFFGLLAFVWYTIMIVQTFLGYGTAYRYTKNGGDNGVAFFGWAILTTLAATIPYLGYYLWEKSKIETQHSGNMRNIEKHRSTEPFYNPSVEQEFNAGRVEVCPFCHNAIPPNSNFCPKCGHENTMSENVDESIKRCGYCASKYQKGAKYCPKCGKETPPSQAYRKSAQNQYYNESTQIRRCRQCNAIVPQEDYYCPKCWAEMPDSHFTR